MTAIQHEQRARLVGLVGILGVLACMSIVGVRERQKLETGGRVYRPVTVSTPRGIRGGTLGYFRETYGGVGRRVRVNGIGDVFKNA
eukprot:138632-Amorphochlora_amoeboformis.AAC.1